MEKEKKDKALDEVFDDQEELDLSSIPEEYAFKEGDAIEKENARKQKRHLIFGALFSVLQLVASGCLMYELITLDLLPNKYLIVIGIVLVILFLFTILSQTARNGRVVGRVYALILSVAFIVGSFYLWRTNKAITDVTDTKITGVISDVRVVVLSDSPCVGLKDLNDKSVGIQATIDRENTDQTVKNLNEVLGQSLFTIEYNNYHEAVEALYNKAVDAIIINTAFASVHILNDYPDFESKTKVLESFTYTKPIEESSSKPAEESSEENAEPVQEDEQYIYHVYLSGNDAFGEITTQVGRSDVNILATVNTKTHTVLLTNTPRDYYVQLTNGAHDKLTHAGILGINESMSILENLYEIDLDYYVRVNFDGFEGIIDALGGVEVYSEYEFTTVSGFYFQKGYNYVNGESALSFAREREAFGVGDIQRGRNQMFMIQAMIKKILSPAVLSNYLTLLDSVTNCFATNIPKELISKMVKNQLNDNAEWTVITQEVTGEGNMRLIYSAGDIPMSVIDPDYNSIVEAIDRIRKVENGEPVEQPEMSSTFVVGQ